MVNLTRARLGLLAAAALLGAGCSSSFTPGSVLNDLRVLAVAPEPPEVGPGETVTLRATPFALPGDPLSSEAWSFCPLTTGPSTGYRCVAAACEVPLGGGPSVTADPSALALACLATLGGSVPGGGAVGLPAQVETVFRYVATSASGQTRTAVARVALDTRAVPSDRNLAPVIQAVEIAGAPATPGAVTTTARPGEEVPIVVRVDPASVQTYVDANGRTVAEQVVVFFFTTAGRFPDGKDRGTAPTADATLELRELAAGDAEAALYVVARDLRGGEAVAGPFRVAIAR